MQPGGRSGTSSVDQGGPGSLRGALGIQLSVDVGFAPPLGLLLAYDFV